MDFKKSLPSTLYRNLTELYPHRFTQRVAGRDAEIRIDNRWSLRLDRSCGPLAKLAANDLRELLKQTFGQSLKATQNAPAIEVCVEDLSLPAESYRLSVSKAGVKIIAQDDEAAMRGLFALSKQMLSRRAPLLNCGQSTHKPQWRLRITCPVLHEPIDDPQDYLTLPPQYLTQMARHGYNAAFIYLDLFDFISPSMGPGLARPGYRERIRKLQQASAYLARFGVRLLFHVNTLTLPKDDKLFKKIPAMRGAQTWFEGLHCLCSSSPKVLTLYERAAEELFAKAPDLAGAVMITGGECFIHCYTRPMPKTKQGTNCPRCSKHAPEDVIAGVVNAFTRGATKSRPDAHLLMWPYSSFSWGDLDAQKRLLEKIDSKMSLLAAFEKDQWLTIDGTRSYVFDYSISQPGPSPRFKALEKTAREQGLNRFAKTESSVCIEMFCIPRIPVMHQWANRFETLRKNKLDGLHTSWRLYGFCAQRTDEVVDYYNWAPKPDADVFLRDIASRDFGLKAAGHVVKAWQGFSDAFTKHPYCGGVTGFPYFRGPFYIGAAHPFVFDLTAGHGLGSDFWQIDPNMVEGIKDEALLEQTRRPLFFVDLTWTQPFGGAIIEKRLGEIDKQWQRALKELERARVQTRGRDRERWQEEYDIALWIGSMYRTALHLARFQLLREQVTTKPCTPKQFDRTLEQVISLLHDEIANTEAALEAVERQPMLGFGPTYGQAFDADLIRQKLANTHWQIDRAIPDYRNNYAFHVFGRPFA